MRLEEIEALLAERVGDLHTVIPQDTLIRRWKEVFHDLYATERFICVLSSVLHRVSCLLAISIYGFLIWAPRPHALSPITPKRNRTDRAGGLSPVHVPSAGRPLACSRQQTVNGRGDPEPPVMLQRCEPSRASRSTRDERRKSDVMDAFWIPRIRRPRTLRRVGNFGAWHLFFYGRSVRPIR